MSHLHELANEVTQLFRQQCTVASNIFGRLIINQPAVVPITVWARAETGIGTFAFAYPLVAVTVIVPHNQPDIVFTCCDAGGSLLGHIIHALTAKLSLSLLILMNKGRACIEGTPLTQLARYPSSSAYQLKQEVPQARLKTVHVLLIVRF